MDMLSKVECMLYDFDYLNAEERDEYADSCLFSLLKKLYLIRSSNNINKEKLYELEVLKTIKEIRTQIRRAIPSHDMLLLDKLTYKLTLYLRLVPDMLSKEEIIVNIYSLCNYSRDELVKSLLEVKGKYKLLGAFARKYMYYCDMFQVKAVLEEMMENFTV